MMSLYGSWSLSLQVRGVQYSGGTYPRSVCPNYEGARLGKPDVQELLGEDSSELFVVFFALLAKNLSPNMDFLQDFDGSFFSLQP